MKRYLRKEQKLQLNISRRESIIQNEFMLKVRDNLFILNDCGCEAKVVSKCSEEEHAKNRRTEFKVISTGNDKVKVKNNSPDSFGGK